MSDIRKTERGLTSPPPPQDKNADRVSLFVVIANRATREREREKAILETYLFTHTTHREAQTR